MANVDIDILDRVYEVVNHKYEGVYEVGSKTKIAIVEERTIECMLEELLDVIQEQEDKIKELSRTDEERYDDFLWQEADNYNDDVKLGLR